LIHELGLTENVEMLGGVGHREVIRLIRSSEVFVQHSVVAPDGDREGSPLSVLEAMAAGIPVVSTRHEGIEDAVEHGITGYLVEEGDVDEMARNLILLLQNPGLARALGRAGRVRAEARFSLVRSLADLSRVLEEPHRMRP